MAALEKEDVHILRAGMDDVTIFTEYYFGVKLLPHQIRAAHAPQTSILTLGGRGSGKTFGYVFIYLWMMTLMPDLRVLWTSYTSDQASIAFYDVLMPYVLASDRFEKFLPNGERSLKKKPYPEIHIQIPGTRLPESVMSFKPVDASGSGDTKRGFTLDCIHIDEGGLIWDSKVISTLRPSMRGRRNVEGSPPRLGRMSVSTTPTAAGWLRDWWDRANDQEHIEYSPDKFLAMRVRSSENTSLTAEQVESFSQDMTAEEKQVEIDAEFPEFTGNEFSPTVVDLCEDIMLNREMDDAKESASPGYEHIIQSKVGTTIFQMPSVKGRKYLLSGDPGTGDPPYRNAACIMCFDITEKPYTLVYFHWVSGGGDYRPFFRNYEWAYHYYEPQFSVFDATGTQRAMDQLYFEDRGLLIEGMSITNEKPAMINATKILLQRGLLRFPYIKGLRLQLLQYKQENDKKLAQDLVMTLVMAGWKMRILHYRDIEDIETGGGDGYDNSRDALRDPVRNTGRQIHMPSIQDLSESHMERVHRLLNHSPNDKARTLA